MRVVHINTFGRYSTGNIAGQILSSLKEDDYKLLIYGLEDSEYPFARKINIKTESFFHIVFNRLFGRHGRYSYFNTLRIIHAIDKAKPDVLHLHNLHGYYMDYVPLFNYIKRKNIKTIWTLHDCWPFTGFCPYFDYIQCDKWKTQCRECPICTRGYMKSYYVDSSKEEFNKKRKTFCGVKNMTIVCPSEWLSQLVKKSFLKEYEVKVINNGINTDVFKHIDKHTFDSIIDRSKKIILGVAAPFEEKKGFIDYLKLPELLPNNYQVVMVGLDEERIKKIPSTIIGIKKTKSQEELAELYSIADVFVNLTYEDNYPTVNLEALSCGTPIVTYNTGGSIESITKENGIIVEKGNIKAASDAIMEICGKNYNRNNISIEAQKLYSRDKMAQEYIKLYQDN